MSPEEQIRIFLEKMKNEMGEARALKIAQVGLNRYVEYLRVKKLDRLPIEPEIIDRYREYLYLERSHNRETAWQYIKTLSEFYEDLKRQGLIQINPVRPYRFRKAPLKERYYADEEIWRAYLASRRKIYSGPYYMPNLIRAQSKISSIMAKLQLRLQELDQASLQKVCEELDRYRGEWGTVLCLYSRKNVLSFLKALLRWMNRNGYIKEDLAWGLDHPWTAQNADYKKINPFDDIDPIWRQYEDRYIEASQVRLMASTCRRMRQNLKWFWRYLTLIGIKDTQQITREVLEGYRARIYERKDWADATRCGILGVSRYFMGWLEKTDQILINPTHRMDWPKRSDGLPTRLMSAHDVSMIMSGPDVKTPFGLRARALFELMYSTGVRAGEAAGVRIEDVDFENGLLKVQLPKGGPSFQRVVPIGEAALDWVRRYLADARYYFVERRENERRLFLSRNGNPLESKTIGSMMRYYCIKLGMRKIYSSHSWRVTCATAMLKNKADIRHVQEQLGHRSLESTKLYTRLFPMDLKKVHQKTHPREKEYRRRVAIDPKN